MVYFLVLILMLAAFAAVGWPLLSSAKRTLSFDSETSVEWEKLVDERDAAYKAIKELEFEQQLGNLSSEDYETLRERYRKDAAAVLGRLDELRRSGRAQTAAEATVETAAPRAATAASHASKRESAASPAAGAVYSCPSCGKSVPVEDRFCWNCGAAVQSACPGCGSVRPASDVFCGQCGARMESKA